MEISWTGRWTIGVVILIQLIAFDEIGGPTAIFSSIIAAICSLLSAKCKSSIKHLQIPYLRASHKFDYFCLFLALWMDILTLLTACAALARTLSTCLDAMTGGIARLYILGRNSSENEPWPDVLGVCVVFLITGMFMLGLENTKIFSILMITSVLGIFGLLTTISILRGNLNAWQFNNLLPNGIFGLLTGSALNLFTYPTEFPASSSADKQRTLFGCIIVIFVCLSNVLIGGFLSTVMKFDVTREFAAVPILSLLEFQDFHKAIPAIACLLVLACSGAYLELFPEMYHLIVRLSTSEWKILSRQIGYENSDSGSPVLAIFTGGSVCAMLAFACPLENIIHILAASNLCSGILRAFYLLYSPFRPKYMSTNKNETNLAYSRLETEPRICDNIINNLSNNNNNNNNNNNSIGTSNIIDIDGINNNGNNNSSRRSIWSLHKTKSLHNVISKSTLRLMKNKRNEEIEREWLLLGEPQSPRILTNNLITANSCSNSNTINTTSADTNIECSVLCEPHISDVDCIVQPSSSDDEHNINNNNNNNNDNNNNNNNNNSDSDDSSTDIDAVVDEYRQKIKVSTAGPMEKTIKVPTVGTWSFTIICIGIELFMFSLIIIGVIVSSLTLLIFSLIVCFIISIIMIFIPKYNHTPTSPSAITCTITLLFEIILLMTTISNSWGGILFWMFAGFILFMRCDRWINNLCLERPQSSQILIHNVTSASNVPSTRISQTLCSSGGNAISSVVGGIGGSTSSRLLNNRHHHHHHR